jgi:hypothetical protein
MAFRVPAIGNSAVISYSTGGDFICASSVRVQIVAFGLIVTDTVFFAKVNVAALT